MPRLFQHTSLAVAIFLSGLASALAFADPLSVTIPDPDHSANDERFLLVGMTAVRRLVVVAHSEHGDEIRLISARLATRHERETYEEGE